MHDSEATRILTAGLRDAVGALQRGRPDLARQRLENLGERFADHPDRLQLLGLACKAEGRLEEAETALRRSLALAPRQPHVHNNLGNLLRQSARGAEAIDCYRTAIRLQPDYADAWRNLGLALTDQQQPFEARDALQQALSLLPNDPSILTKLGECHLLLEDHEAALACFRSALEARPDHINAYLGLGHLMRLTGQLDDAQQLLEQAARLAPDDPRIMTALAHLDVDRADMASAEDRYRAVLSRHPRHGDAHTHLNELLWQRGEQAQYGRTFRDALQLAPDDAQLLLSYAQSLSAVGLHEQSLDALESRRGTVERFPGLLGERARVRRALGDRDAALADLDRAVDLAPDLPALRLDRAQLAIRMADYTRALADLDVVERTRPFDQLMWACRGLCWQETDPQRAAWLYQDNAYIQSFELPCPDGYADLGAFLAALRDRLVALHQMRAAPTQQTLVGGTQTPGLLLQRPEPELQALRASLETVIRRYLDSFEADDRHPLLRRRSERFRFSGSWSVALRAGGYHVNHVHPAGWISSAFYVSVPDDLGTNDEDPRGWLRFGLSGLDLGERERLALQVRPRAGWLTLFPSYTWHGTAPFESEAVRMTAPFDVVPVGASGR